MSREPIDPALREQALELARSEGVAVAAERTGIKAGTIRVWLSRAAKAAAPAQTTGQTTAQPDAFTAASDTNDLDAFETRILERAKNAVELALTRLEELLPVARGVQSVAISSGILLDKVERLHQTIAETQERQVRIAERDGQLIADAIRHYFEVLELPFGDAGWKAWAALLRQLAHGEALGVPAEALEVRAELQRAMRERWRWELEREIRAKVEAEFEERARVPRALPPAPEPPEPEPDDGVEVVTGEVVAEPIVEPGGWTVDPVSGRRTRPFRPGGRPPAGRQFGRGAW